MFFYYFTTLADGRVASIPESRTYAASTLPGGSVSTSYGNFVPVSTTISSDASSATDGSSIGSGSSVADGSSATPSPSSGSDASASSGASQANPGTVTSVVYNTAVGGASATSSSPSSTSSAALEGGSGTSNTPPASVLAGGIVGGVAGLAALLLVALVFVRWYRRRGATSMERIGAGGSESGAGDSGFVSRSGPGMAERAGLLPLAGMFRNRHAPETAPAGERGFERVGGRKLPSAFSGGMSGPEGPSRRPIPMPAVFETGNPSSHGGRNLSNTSFYRDSHGMYGGSGDQNPFGDPRMSETLHPGPARQAAVHPGGPYHISPTGSPPPEQSMNLLEGRSATPINAPMTPTFPQSGSRFAEEV